MYAFVSEEVYMHKAAATFVEDDVTAEEHRRGKAKADEVEQALAAD